MDASLLLLPLVGFLPATRQAHPDDGAGDRKKAAVKGLVQRYETETGVDGLPPGEGAFLACSFWLADNYLLQGRRSEALAAVQPAEKALPMMSACSRRNMIRWPNACWAISPRLSPMSR